MSDDRAYRAYIAVAPCGCVHGIDFENGPETADQVAKWIRRGSTVERVASAVAKHRLTNECPHDPKWGREVHDPITGRRREENT